MALVVATSCLTAVLVEAQQPASATVFEGARLIVGDGSAPITDAAFLVENGRFTAVGKKGQLKVPAGAARVDLTGKTVMPAIVDMHKHLAVTRDALVDQLQHLAYYGIGVAMSLGQDTGDVAFQVRAETIPNAARFRTAGRGLTGPEPGRTQAPTGSNPGGGSKGRSGIGREKSRSRQDLGGRPGSHGHQVEP